MVPEELRPKEIKPVLAGYLSEAISLLSQMPVPDDEAIHDIRVLMKKARASVKLLAPQLDKDILDREYSTYRDAGRLLASQRDSSVFRKTLKSVRKSHRGLITRLESEEKIKNVLAKKSGSTDTDDRKKAVVSARQLLVRAKYRLRFIQLKPDNSYQLLQELNNIYINVAKLYLKCRNKPSPGMIHRFRKRSKDLLYNLYYVRPLNPGGVRKQEKKLEYLTQYLGRYNDLEQLLRSLEYKLDNPENSPDINELIIIIRDAGHSHLAKVWKSAYDLYCPGQTLTNLLRFKIIAE